MCVALSLSLILSLRGRVKERLMRVCVCGGAGQMAGMHLYMKYTQPLFIQGIMPLKALYDSKVLPLSSPSPAGGTPLTHSPPPLYPPPPRSSRSTSSTSPQRATSSAPSRRPRASLPPPPRARATTRRTPRRWRSRPRSRRRRPSEEGAMCMRVGGGRLDAGGEVGGREGSVAVVAVPRERTWGRVGTTAVCRSLGSAVCSVCLVAGSWHVREVDVPLC